MAIQELQASARAGKLIIVCGAGTSAGLASTARAAPSWPTLIQSGLEYGKGRSLISAVQVDRWSQACQSDDLDDLLGAAQFVCRKLGGRTSDLYARWLASEFEHLSPDGGPMVDAIYALASKDIPLCTLNYDTLLESVTGLPTVAMADPRAVMGWGRREINGILHLHGVWTSPETCVMGISDYDSASTDEFRGNLQRALASFQRLLFVGCGQTLSDPNFSALISWMKRTIGAASLQHYALVRDSEVTPFNAQPQNHGFVEAIGYGTDFANLPSYLSTLASGGGRSAKKPGTATDALVIDSYRQFIIKDCGRMTIEGVAADTETAKQKFDIEQLFVPLKVNAVQPDIAATDPDREIKLKKWQEKHKDPVPFGAALKGNRKIALLALPGGGKTLLLKRLAVAYADKDRREVTNDQLPPLDVLPLLIRCREWRDHIRLPIPGMIKRIGEITGRPELDGLFDAIVGRLTNGRILLLVDGLDEIHNDADRTIFVEHLESFLSEYPRIRLIVTSREAGFSLVAPNITRFCTKWRVSALDDDAIKLLCSYWHQLMSGESRESIEDAENVSEAIINSDALKRLAENPLLLTMLLVVKHGYGRLPPDRVSLYERAVEVLLDTWNIKGHEALSPREAVPQLAYIAFRMMKEGKQTVTEKQLLRIVEDCRAKVPLVNLYAKDTPSQFLKRVELRSSLLLEGGRVSEGGKVVPFYQFRHLTFQEYLAAVAAVEGHYDDYEQGASPLVPLAQTILSDEWKEIIPMAAVLAKKQADPLIRALVEDAKTIESSYIAAARSRPEEIDDLNYKIPTSVSRLSYCLAEEAEFSKISLPDTIRLVATFAHGCSGPESWSTIATGPFGEAITSESWRLYRDKVLPIAFVRKTWLRNTACSFQAFRVSLDGRVTDEFVEQLRVELRSDDEERIGLAAATVCGLMWLYTSIPAKSLLPLLPSFERALTVERSEVYELVAWAIGFFHVRFPSDRPEPVRISDSSLDIIISNWSERYEPAFASIDEFTLAKALRRPRDSWRPNLDEGALTRVRAEITKKKRDDRGAAMTHRFDAAVLLAFHHRDLLEEVGLAEIQKARPKSHRTTVVMHFVKNQLAAEAGG